MSRYNLLYPPLIRRSPPLWGTVVYYCKQLSKSNFTISLFYLVTPKQAKEVFNIINRININYEIYLLNIILETITKLCNN